MRAARARGLKSPGRRRSQAGTAEADVDDPGVKERSVDRQPPPGPAQRVEVRVLGARGLQGETLAQGTRARCGVGALRAGPDEPGQSGAAAPGEPAGRTQSSAPAGCIRGVGKYPRSGAVEHGGGEMGQRLRVAATSGGRDGAQEGVGSCRPRKLYMRKAPGPWQVPGAFRRWMPPGYNAIPTFGRSVCRSAFLPAYLLA